jgi:uncharacterized protein
MHLCLRDLAARNPQKYIPDIYEANAADFIRATERIYTDRVTPSWLEVLGLP